MCFKRMDSEHGRQIRQVQKLTRFPAPETQKGPSGKESMREAEERNETERPCVSGGGPRPE